MLIAIYSVDHPVGFKVDWNSIPRVGDSVVLQVGLDEKVYEVEVIRWLIDDSGQQTGLEIHMGSVHDFRVFDRLEASLGSAKGSKKCSS